jgi:hypothetical protein
VDAHAFDTGVINYPSGMSMLSPTDVRRDRAHTRGLVRSSSWVRSSWEREATSAKEKKNTEPTRVSATEAIDIKVYDSHPSAVVLIRDASSSNACNACRAYDEQPPRPEGRPSSPAPNIHTPHTTSTRTKTRRACRADRCKRGRAPRRPETLRAPPPMHTCTVSKSSR